LDSQGRLVTSQGYAVKIDGAGVIPASAEELTVDKDGVIYGKVGGAFHQYGKIVLTMIPNPAGLEAVGSNLYRETTQSGTGVNTDPGQKGAGFVLSGYLENSNVEVVTEMVNLIVAQRAFELNSKSVEAADQMWAIANNIRR
jgi:flagellar basal-body rod protein FlgG